MKKLILFVILDQYADWEAAYLASAIHMTGQNNYDTRTVSLRMDSVTSIGGFHTVPDYDLATVPSDYEALILVGGMSWRTEVAGQVKALVNDCLEKGKILGAICDASAFLGTAGALNYGKHTSNDLEDMKKWAGDAYTGEKNYVLEQAVCDKNIITANGTAALEFAREVLLALKSAPEKKIMDWYQFHKLGYYEAPMPENATDWAE